VVARYLDWGTREGAFARLRCETCHAEKHDESDLAKTVQNPLANLVSFPMQTNYNLGVGEFDRTFFNLNIQSVIPYPGEKWNVITRTG
jgi:hypothetical protein